MRRAHNNRIHGSRENSNKHRDTKNGLLLNLITSRRYDAIGALRGIPAEGVAAYFFTVETRGPHVSTVKNSRAGGDFPLTKIIYNSYL